MWAIKRRLIIIAVVLLFIAVCISVPLVIYYTSRPVGCNNGVQDAAETGIDCGGVCARMCTDTLRPITVSWSRILPVSQNVYSIAFEMQNKNFNAIAWMVPYQCTVYDKDLQKLKTFQGGQSISAAGNYVVALVAIDVANSRIPDSVSCKTIPSHEWLQLPKSALPNPFQFSNVALENTDTRPRINATVRSIEPIRVFRDITFVASVYDASDSIVAVSTTHIDTISPTVSQSLVYTWPKAFQGTPPFIVRITPLFIFPEYEYYTNK